VADGERDEPIGMMTLAGLPVFVEDSPLTRALGWYVVLEEPSEADDDADGEGEQS